MTLAFSHVMSLLLSELGLCCCMQPFSSCGEWGLLSRCGAPPSLVAEDRGLQWLTALGLSSCGWWALGYKCFVFDSHMTLPDTIIKSPREKLTRAVSSSFLREPLGQMSSSMLEEAAGQSLLTPHLGRLLLGLCSSLREQHCSDFLNWRRNQGREVGLGE